MQLSRTEWFRLLPNGMSGKAFKNTKKALKEDPRVNYEKFMNMKFGSALMCLMASFPFVTSIEGHDYWIDEGMTAAAKIDKLTSLTDLKSISLN